MELNGESETLITRYLHSWIQHETTCNLFSPDEIKFPFALLMENKAYTPLAIILKTKQDA